MPEFDGFRYSYWALFGAVNIVTFPLAYVIFDLFTLISVVGVVVWFVRNRRSERFMLAVDPGGLRAARVWRSNSLDDDDARLARPLDVSGHHGDLVVAVAGLGDNFQFSIFNDQLEASLRWAMPIFMLATAIVVPFRDIAPTYAGPQMISEQQLPSDLKRLDVDYGDQLRLIGYRAAEPLARSDSVEFTLYWQCLKPIAADYSVFVIVYGRQLQEVGKRDAYPYHGLYATRQCQPGQIFADPYRIPIKRDAQIGRRCCARRLA